MGEGKRDKNREKGNWRNFSLRQRALMVHYLAQDRLWFQSPLCHLLTVDDSFNLNSSHVNWGIIMVFRAVVRVIEGYM